MHGQLVLLRKLIHTEDGNDILQLIVSLKDLFDALGAVVMCFSNDVGSKYPGCRIKRINSRIDTELGDLTAQNRGGIEVGKCCRGSGVGKVIGRYIYCLNRCDGTVTRRCNTLLHYSHLG